MRPEFRYTILIGKSAEEVWAALTEKGTVDRYYMVPLHTLELNVGGKISYGRDSEMITGRITGIEAPKTLAHTFGFVGSEDPETYVSYSITAIGDAMCSLEISHTGFTEENQTFADVAGGWPVIACSMKTLLETGRGLPWPVSQA